MKLLEKVWQKLEKAKTREFYNAVEILKCNGVENSQWC